MNNQAPTASEKDWALMCHLCPLIPLLIIIALIFGGAEINFWIHLLSFSRLIFPLYGWMIGEQNNSRWIVHHAKSSLNFQITYSILFYIPWIISSMIANDIISQFITCPDDSLPIEEREHMPCHGRITRMEGFVLGLLLLPVLISLVVTEGILLLIHVILVLKAANLAQEPTEEKVGETSRIIYPKTYPLVIPFFRTSQNSR